MDPRMLMVVLRVLHIVAGAVWVGTVVAIVRFILPSVAAMGPAGGALMRELARLRLVAFTLLAMSITVLSGLGMMWSLETASRGLWTRTPMGQAISAGAVLGILAGILGITIVRPTSTRLLALGAEIAASAGPPPEAAVAEMLRLRARMARMTRVIAVLVLLATGFMAVARYV
jgi:hypothetical protein